MTTFLSSILFPHWPSLFLACIAIFCASIVTLAVPVWVKHLVKTILPSRNLILLQNHLLLGILLILFLQFLVFSKDYIRLKLSHRLGCSLRARLFRQVLDIDIVSLSDHQRGDIISRLSNDILVFQNGLMRGIFRIVPNGIVLIALTGMMIVYSFKLTVLTVVLFAPLILVSHHLMDRIRRGARSAQEGLAEVNNLVEESIAGIREIRSFGREDYVNDRFSRINETTYRHHIRRDLWSALHPALVLAGMTLAASIMIFLSARLIIIGSSSLDVLIAFLTALALAISPIQEIAGSLGFIGRLQVVFARFREIQDRTQNILPRSSGTTCPPVSGEISFRNVTFSYGNKEVLKGITLDIQRQESLAIVGPSGAGKTTLLNLVFRFIECDSGTILVDGLPIVEYDVRSYRHQLALVGQEPVLFYGTLAENILFSRPDATQDEMLAAARSAHVHDFAEDMEAGYRTMIGTRGSKLSAGQRQRVALARAFLVPSRILVLDEPTSALDPESERLIQDSLLRLKKQCTTIIVAHRLSTIRHVDRIIVLDNGKVAESGTHDELLNKKSLFHKLYSLHHFID